MASKSLGPFPKTLRWREIVGSTELADEQMLWLKGVYERLENDHSAFQGLLAWASLPIGTRDGSISSMLGRPVKSVEDVLDGLDSSEVSAAVRSTIEHVMGQPELSLFETDPWKVWREYDGPPFCDLARLFYSYLNEVYLMPLAPGREREVRRFAWEASYITRSFSARWFNACARHQTPEVGSIKWYFGHCLGKLDLELSREMSDWVEPSGNPWRRKRKAVEAGLGFESA